MREESVDRIWPFDPDKCGITELCPDGRRISCQGPVGTCKRLYGPKPKLRCMEFPGNR